MKEKIVAQTPCVSTKEFTPERTVCMQEVVRSGKEMSEITVRRLEQEPETTKEKICGALLGPSQMLDVVERKPATGVER